MFKDTPEGSTNSFLTPIIEVVRRAGEWTVQFGIGNQFFELYYSGTKAEANWMAKMLKKAFSKTIMRK